MKHRTPIWCALLLLLVAVLSILARSSHAQNASGAQTTRCQLSFPLPNPSDIGPTKFEKMLYAFLEQGCYRSWIADNRIRDSGPFINGTSFGTHDSVKIFYSPEIWDWLKVRNREGEIRDGGIIVKEMFPAPAKEGAKLTGWTVMVKDKKGAFDGWYWSYHAPNYAPATPGIDYPDSGYGLYCLRCHASAEKESTFITVKNVEGDPISFNILQRTMQPLAPSTTDQHAQVATTNPIPVGPFAAPRASTNPEFLKLFLGMPDLPLKSLKSFPGEALDEVAATAGGPKGFVTSSQCLGCHSATNEIMSFAFVDPKRKPINLSQYTEWRASMMGLAGRDPIFHAQLESEKTLYPERREFFDNTCYRCHGVMGQRQLNADRKQPFSHEIVYALPEDPYGKYGALARDGISCVVCHQMSATDLGTPAVFTGKFKVDSHETVNGPYDQVATLPMKQAMGITPRIGEQIKKSALCGSCHTVILPVFDEKGRAVLDKNGKPKEFHEQMTYPEWLNSAYQNEHEPINQATVRTCQDCHMAKKFLGQQLVFRAANIEDNTYPFTDFRAADKDLTLRVRDQFSRHTLTGLNQFGLMMFQQFPSVLGIRTADYMYAAGVLGLQTSQDSSNDLAKSETARIEVTALRKDDKSIEAGVRIENLAGHGFPSGVAFRRAFITFEGLDETGNVVWASGRTNSIGAIVKGVTEEVLPTEFFYDPATRKQIFQPHYQTITAENQVQIYEELIADPQGKITTSFTALNQPLKNNRLQPKGWRSDGPYGEFTAPHGEAEKDPDYSGSGAGASGADAITYRIPLNDVTRKIVAVRVTLNYQSIPPYYLRDRFTIGKGAETQRLAYLTSHLNLDHSPLEGWKLPMVTAMRRL